MTLYLNNLLIQQQRDIIPIFLKIVFLLEYLIQKIYELRFR